MGDYYFIYYGLTIIALLVTLLAEFFVNSSYSKYRKVRNKKGITGKDAAREILDKNGLSNVKVEMVGGHLSDHYDPRTKTVRLSKEIYDGASIAAVSVASHECGHALQDKDNYVFMRFRSSLVPITNFSTKIGYFAILFGFMFGALKLLWIGIILEVVVLLFQLVTLPVEFNASSRALKEIEKRDFLVDSELRHGKRMLSAAAFTYVASVISIIIEILRLILMARSRDN